MIWSEFGSSSWSQLLIDTCEDTLIQKVDYPELLLYLTKFSKDQAKIVISAKDLLKHDLIGNLESLSVIQKDEYFKTSY